MEAGGGLNGGLLCWCGQHSQSTSLHEWLLQIHFPLYLCYWEGLGWTYFKVCHLLLCFYSISDVLNGPEVWTARHTLTSLKTFIKLIKNLENHIFWSIKETVVYVKIFFLLFYNEECTFANLYTDLYSHMHICSVVNFLLPLLCVCCCHCSV